MPEKMAEKRSWATPSARQKRIKLVTGVVIAAALLGPLSLLIALTQGDPPPVDLPRVPVYKSHAEVVVKNWVNGDPSPIPVQSGLTLYLGRPEEAKPLPIKNLAWAKTDFEVNATSPSFGVEIHTFNASMLGDMVFVQIVITDSEEGPVVVANPTIMPVRYRAIERDKPFGSVGEELTITSGMRTVAGEWATAYGLSDSETLFRITGGKDRETYRGIPTGDYYVVGAPNVIVGVTSPNGNNFLRVIIQYAPLVAEEENPGGQTNTTTTIPATEIKLDPSRGFTLEFDLLLGDPERELPFITAWGPPGTGPTLEPYQNSLVSTFVDPTNQSSQQSQSGSTTPTTRPSSASPSSPSGTTSPSSTPSGSGSGSGSGDGPPIGGVPSDIVRPPAGNDGF